MNHFHLILNKTNMDKSISSFLKRKKAVLHFGKNSLGLFEDFCIDKVTY